MTVSAGARSVSVEGVFKAFDEDPVLVDVTLEVAPGEAMALLGPSGCGKTTLLRLVAGLERLDAGTIRVADTVVAGDDAWVAPERRKVGLVFQDWALFPHMNVAKNVGYGLARKDRGGPKIDEALAMVGLAGLGDRMPDTLSGGQQQRVALARALAPRPGVLLLDEPFSNLDTALRVEVRSEVHRLLHDLGITSIYVTHDQEEAFVLGDRVAVMHEGRIEQVATPVELYTAPDTRWVAGFVGGAAFLPAVAQGNEATSAIGSIPLQSEAHGAVEVLLRPEQLRLAPGEAGEVVQIEYYGHDSLVFVDVGDAVLSVRAGTDPAVGRGDRVDIEYGGRGAVAFAV
ncbi:MAG: ABC transporter ATP-binding protein [Acidimicrobiales bacterium]